jgi:hypothetical protein
VRNAARRRSLLFPREHGAWGLLLVPLVTGAAVGLRSGGPITRLVPLVIAALALFWLRTPVESWLGTAPMRAQPGGELRLVRRTAVMLAVLSLLALVWLFWDGRNPDLVWIGAVAAVAFVAQALLRKAWRNARIAAQIIGAAGLTSTAPAACYVASGHWSSAAWTLWIANFAFAANQIHFVQLRIHSAPAATKADKIFAGRGFLAGQFLLVIALGLACAFRVFPWYGALAFLPLLYRGFTWFARKSVPLAVRALGWSELGYALAFGVLLALGVGVMSSTPSQTRPATSPTSSPAPPARSAFRPRKS